MKKTAGMKGLSPVLRDTHEREKNKAESYYPDTLYLWNYAITGISHHPSVQIIEVHCRCLQSYITGQRATKSTIIPGFQPIQKQNRDIINPSDQLLLMLTI